MTRLWLPVAAATAMAVAAGRQVALGDEAVAVTALVVVSARVALADPVAAVSAAVQTAVETAAAVARAVRLVGATQAEGPPAARAAQTGAQKARVAAEERESRKVEVGAELPVVAEG